MARTTGRWTTAAVAIVIATGLAMGGCRSSGDGMMKKDDKMMDKK